MIRLLLLTASLALSSAAGAGRPAQNDMPSRPADAATRAAAQAVTTAAQAELADKAVPSIAVALFDRNGLLWADAWGHQDAAGTVAATSQTIYRAGSVSKLLTDVAIMRLVERGRLDLDAPVVRYLPGFRPHNPFGTPITLRHLMTHRSGLVREPPRGHYFDVAARGQADAVASLNDTTLVARPGTITKYSNAGIAVAGEVVARVMAKPFDAAVRSLVLAPVGMTDSAFARPAGTRNAYGQMASSDGGRWAAPTWDLGTPAAGSLYTDVGDLARFGAAMLNRGALAGKAPLLRIESMAEMWREQYPSGPGTRRFGLGFVLGTLDGAPTVGHGGAVYGHVADLRLMPDAGIGVVVLATIDSGPVAQRLGSFALRALRDARAGGTPGAWSRSTAIVGPRAARLSGRYVDGPDSVWLRIFDDRLVLEAPERAAELRAIGDAVVLDDGQSFDEAVTVAADGSALTLAGRRFARAEEWRRPPPPAAEFAALIGEYGWDYNVLRIYERDGRPYVRIEWVDWLPLTRLATDRYAFPRDRGLYPFEELRFERDARGTVTAALLGAIRFPRRDFGAEGEAAVRAGISTGLDVLRTRALRATPPREATSSRISDLVAVRALEPAIRLDIRYASTDNFMGQRIYEQAGAFLQRPAAEAVARIHRTLATKGFGLLIHDAYRPWYVTKMFWDATPPANRIFVADPAKGSRHNRGAAVDLTMFDLTTRRPVLTTGRYDEFSSRSYSNYVGGTDEQRWLRETLRTAMESDGFAVYPQEWWHFDFGSWRDFPIGNQRFADLANAIEAR